MGYRKYLLYLTYIAVIIGVIHIGVLDRNWSGAKYDYYSRPIEGRQFLTNRSDRREHSLSDTTEGGGHVSLENGKNKEVVGLPETARDHTPLDLVARWTVNGSGFVKIHDGLYYYSAFVDLRTPKPYLRVTILSIFRARELHIQLQIGDYVLEGEFYEFCENHGLRMRGYYVSFPIPEGFAREGDLATAVIRSSRHPRKWTHVNPITVVPLKYKPNGGHRQFKLSLCVPVLFGHHYDIEIFIEFFELNKILGFEHIFLYVHIKSLNEDALGLLRFYEADGFITLFNWNIPGRPEDVWNYGQIIAVQDCLYRNMGLSKYVVFNDIDEYVIPQGSEKTLPDLLDISWTNQTLAGFGLLTAYFAQNSDLGKPITLQNVERSAKLDAVLTKCVVRPEYIFEMGIHHISRVMGGYWVRRLDPKIAILHHYKDCMRSKRINHCLGPSTRNNLVPRKYGETLQKRINMTMKTYRQL